MSSIHPFTPVELRLRKDLGVHGEAWPTFDHVHAKLSSSMDSLALILADTADMQPKLGTPVGTISAMLTTIDTVVDANQVDLDAIIAELANGTYGLSALDTQIDSIEANTDTIETVLGTPTDTDVSNDIANVQTAVDANQADLNTIIAEIGDNVHGSVALDIAAVEAIVSGIQNNTRTTIAINDELEIDSSDKYYKIILSNYDSQGNMEVPDAPGPTVTVENSGGTSRSANLFEEGDGTDTALTAGVMVNDSPGVYFVYYKVLPGATANEQLVFEFSVTEGGLTRTMTRTVRVVEEISSTFTATDRSNLALILGDTSELQTDWVNGGRLDTILDTVASDLVVVDGIVDSIQVDTTAIIADLGIVKNKDGGLTYDQSTDSLEAIREKLDLMQASAALPKLLRASKQSPSIAQGANTLVVLSATEGVTSPYNNIKEIRCVPTTGTCSNFTVQLFEDAAATLPLFEFEKAKGNLGDLKIAIDLIFVNQNGTPDNNIYVKITNVTDSSSSVFDVEVRGFVLTSAAA